MAYLRRTLGLLVLVVVVAALHYGLPSRDVVRIVGTEVKLDTETRSTPDGGTRFVQDDTYYIKTVDSDGEPHVYRNEDNGWYLKFDSADLDTQASNLVSSADDPHWVVMTSYGWRIPILSMYPNAISMGPASGPSETLFPWLKIAAIVVLVLVILILWRVVVILRRRHIDPLVAEVDRRFNGN